MLIENNNENKLFKTKFPVKILEVIIKTENYENYDDFEKRIKELDK